MQTTRNVGRPMVGVSLHVRVIGRLLAETCLLESACAHVVSESISRGRSQTHQLSAPANVHPKRTAVCFFVSNHPMWGGHVERIP
jgi:hypothetical protein